MMKAADKNFKNNPNIKWNFTKFLVDRQGNVAARYESNHSLANVDAAVKKLLKEAQMIVIANQWEHWFAITI